MKGKKNWIWVLTALAICYAGSCTRVWGQEEKELSENVKLLQAEIKELEKTIKSQQNTISELRGKLDEQLEENKRLQALCKKAGIDTVKPVETSFEPNDIVYNGKKRSRKWFDEMYERFHDKIAFIDNNYVDIGEEILDLHGIWVNDPRSEKRRMGVAPYRSTVLSVLGDGEVLINYEYENILHIRGVEHNFVDGEPWPNGTPLIRAGNFDYTASNGRHKTVWSFVVYKPLTKEQIAEAIRSGFELVEYKKVGKETIKRPIR
jgi:regulator of replication initiation timing